MYTGCGFNAPTPPVQCWVQMPTGCARPLAETKTPNEWFVDGITNEAACTARKADYNNHCIKNDAKVEFTAKNIVAPWYFTTLKDTAGGTSARVRSASVYSPTGTVEKCKTTV